MRVCGCTNHTGLQCTLHVESRPNRHDVGITYFLKRWKFNTPPRDDRAGETNRFRRVKYRSDCVWRCRTRHSPHVQGQGSSHDGFDSIRIRTSKDKDKDVEKRRYSTIVNIACACKFRTRKIHFTTAVLRHVPRSTAGSGHTPCIL